jgi:hypothetical protein
VKHTGWNNWSYVFGFVLFKACSIDFQKPVVGNCSSILQKFPFAELKIPTGQKLEHLSRKW